MSSSYAAAADLAGSARAAGALHQAARRQEPAAIREVAQQFEALVLREVLRDMNAGSLAGDVSGSTGGDIYQQMWEAQMASALARGGGLGLGRMLERQLLERAVPGTVGSEAQSGAQQPAVPLQSVPHAWLETPVTGPVLPARVQERTEDPQPRTSVVAGLGESAEAFVERLLPHARWAAAELGVPAAAIIAQAALESSWGRRMPRHADGRPSFNLFGIKAGSRWRGSSAVVSTLEYADGVAVRGSAAFRAYDTLEDGVRDYVSTLLGNPRFRRALAAGGSARDFFAGLAGAGYATDPRYAQKLRSVLASPLLRSLAP